MDLSLLKLLVETPGVSGREERVRDIMAGQFADLGATITTDAMGSLIGHLPGKGPKVALIAHMDEVGFLVSKIEKNGFVRVMPVGGIDPRVLGAQKMMVHGQKDLSGIVGSVPPHLMKNKDEKASKAALPVEESFIDLGLPADEVADLVRIGDPVTFATQSWENAHAFFAKAMDDRVGLYIMCQAVKQAGTVDCDLYLIASTQEEYGLRGAGPAIYSSRPDIALALEGTVASDTPGLKLPPNTAPTQQGQGPEIRLTDRGMIASRQLVDFLVQKATEANIPYQVVVKNTGATDAAAGQVAGPGARVGALSVPVRYIHSPIGVALKKDISATIELVAEFLKHASGAVVC